MRYQIQRDFSRGRDFRAHLFTDAIKVLITMNIGIFLLQTLSQQQDVLFHLFGIVPRNTFSRFMIWQPLTYLFFHAHIWHVLMNMFFLWMFGSEVEIVWGRKKFWKYYFATGVGSGLVWLLFNLGNPTFVLVGASGAIYGILLAYALMFPNRIVYIFPFMIPMKAKWFVIFLGVIGFFSAPNVSHLTHISGMVIGFLYLKSNLRWDLIQQLLIQQKDGLKRRYENKKRAKVEELRLEVDRILDKINDIGYDGLTKSEKSFLYEASKKLSKEEDRD